MAPSKRISKKNVGSKTISQAVAASKKAPSTGHVKKPRRHKPGRLPLTDIHGKQESFEIPVEELACETAENFRKDLLYFENLCADYRKCVPLMIKDVKRSLEITEEFNKELCIFKEMCAFYPKICEKLLNN